MLNEQELQIWEQEGQDEYIIYNILKPILGSVGDLIWYKKTGYLSDQSMCCGTTIVKGDRPLAVWLDESPAIYIEVGVILDPEQLTGPGIGPNASHMEEDFYPTELRWKYNLADPESIDKAQQKLKRIING